MSPEVAAQLAQVVLAVHLMIASFIVLGIIVIVLGGRLGWAITYIFWWRLVHLVAMGAVAVQKLMGNACFLSRWERGLLDMAGAVPHAMPAFQTLGDHVLYWNLPLAFFVWLYGALFAVVIALWFIIPPRRRAPT